MEDLHVTLGDVPQQVLAARHSMILGQKLAGALGEPQHHHQQHNHLNHQLNQRNQLSHLNQLHQLSHLNQLSQLHQHLHHQLNISSGLNLNLGLGHLSHRMQMGLGLNVGLGVSSDMNPEGSITNSTSSTSSTNSTNSTSTCSDQGQGHGSGIGLDDPKRDQSQVHFAHDPAQDNGDSPNVKSCTELSSPQLEGNMNEGDSLTVSKSSSTETDKGEKDKEAELKEKEKEKENEEVKEIEEEKKYKEDNEDNEDVFQKLKLSPSMLLKAANSKLNANATVYTMPAKVETPYDGRPMPEPSLSATSQGTGDFRLNAEAPVFKPSLLGIGPLVSPVVPQPLFPVVSLPLLSPVTLNLLSAHSQPLLPTPLELLAQGFHPMQRLGTKPNARWRKQPLPDLFNAVISLVRELSRSVSYPEIINLLAQRLQRPAVELKRHVPHTLHAAVNNGFLKKAGNRYSLVSAVEQAEIWRRNYEAAIRTKELEKEPLSWRKR